MELSKRPATYAMPSYSLTGDLLGFLRCGLQYRYTRIGQLPSSRPVQMWFGQFIHGVLEESFRRFDLARRQGRWELPPWPEPVLEEILTLIKDRLAAQNLFAWSEELERLGDRRATAAVNELGPELFPIIRRAEVRLNGARPLPKEQIPVDCRFREADRYEMVGIVDVISHVELSDPRLQGNRFVQAIQSALPTALPEKFEVIVDYKGRRRPQCTRASDGPNYWDIYGWQLQTYGHLRSRHEDSLPVVAGALLFLNELVPTRSDLKQLRREAREGTTDVAPEPGSETERLLTKWREKDEPLLLPFEFRFARTIRVTPIDEESIVKALSEFDAVVARIETCRGRELQDAKVLSTWEKNPTDESTCTACDARTFCPSCKLETTPILPGIRS